MNKHLPLACLITRLWNFILYIVLITACAYLPGSQVSVKTITPQPGVVFQGSGVGVGIQSLDGEKWRTYSLSGKNRFQGFYRLNNQLPADSYIITCLIDYQQQPCFYEGVKNLNYRIDMNENEDRYIPFETPILPRGFHDISILAFSKIDTHDLSEDFRYTIEANFHYPIRLVFLVDSDPDSLPLIEYTSGQPRQDGSSSLNGIVVNLDPAPLRIKAWLKQEVEPGEALNYYVQVGNDTGPPQTYALMSFLDYVQIPLNDQKKVEYVSLPPGYRVTVPGKLTAPNERGVHELVILAAYNPYHLLEEPPFGENRERTPVNDWIESSIRVAIIVR